MSKMKGITMEELWEFEKPINLINEARAWLDDTPGATMKEKSIEITALTQSMNNIKEYLVVHPDTEFTDTLNELLIAEEEKIYLLKTGKKRNRPIPIINHRTKK